MKKEAFILYWTGEKKDILPKSGKTFSLEELQEFVGGYIEMLYLEEGKYIMVVNEEGKYMTPQKNEQATRIASGTIDPEDYIAGNALVVHKSFID